LKLNITKSDDSNFLQQQAKLDDFIDCYNKERPHQTLNQRSPAECQVRSIRPYRDLSEPVYPFRDRIPSL
jgi:putative transposase